EETSHSCELASAPERLSTRSSAAFASRSNTATVKPSSLSRREMAAPIPFAPPVTTATGAVRFCSFMRPDATRDASEANGRAVLLRPQIGTLLPVFVIDDYEGFEVKRFIDLSEGELEAYLERNTEALAAAAAWFGPDVVVAGHVVPGAVVAKRSRLKSGYLAK